MTCNDSLSSRFNQVGEMRTVTNRIHSAKARAPFILAAARVAAAMGTSVATSAPVERAPLTVSDLITDDAVMIAGRAPTAPVGSSLTVYADPSLSAQEALVLGDTIATPVIGTGEVGPLGEFVVEIRREQAGLLAHEQVDFTLLGDGIYAGGTLERIDGRLRGLDLGVLDTVDGGGDEAVELAGVELASSSDAEALQCGLTYLSLVEDVPVTVMVLGSNSSYVHFEGTFTSGADRYVGFAVGSGTSWSKASGTYKRCSRRCPSGVTYEVRPSSFVGSETPAKWGSNQYYTHCRSLESRFSVTSGTQTTWSNGVKLGSKGYVDVSSGGSYQSETKTTMDANGNSGRYWCGRDGTPTSNSPGAIMGDWTDR
jgi:hypothetical protein